jgi:hypothetical protein
MWSVRGYRAEDGGEEHEDRSAREGDERKAFDELRRDRSADHAVETPDRVDLLHLP